jgi:carboxyl-terminal processing protease
MSYLIPTLQRGWLALLLLAAVAVGPIAPTAAQEQRVAVVSPQANELWKASLRSVEQGDWDSLTAHLDELSDLGPEGAKVAQWIRARQDLENTRWELTREDREKYVGWAQEEMDKGKIERALDYALRAYSNSTDEDAFRASPWVTKLYNMALAEGTRLRNEMKWLDAHAIYFDLSYMFEHDKELKKLRHECLTHARLEVSYKEDSKWEEQLAGIQWRMAERAFYQIDKYYVTEVDFQKFTLAGLEQLVLLAESSALWKVFPSLAVDFDRKDFITRIEERISQLKRSGEVRRGDATGYFQRALQVNRETVKLPESLVVSEFMNGAMEKLDEFSTIIWPVEFREFDKHTRGDFIGVGISISRRNNQITVVTPLEDSPAYDAGVLAGDIIAAVDGTSTENMSVTKAVETITGPEGTAVTLTIDRVGNKEPIDFRLVRRKIVIQSVKGFERDSASPDQWQYMIDPEMGIAYVRVTAFQKNTVEELRDTLENLRENHGMKSLILDLRANPGGLLRSAVEMSELFLHRDDKIVSTRGERTQDEYPISADRTGAFVDLPLSVLINGSSASASEIVSGALKDHNRALIVGERSFGKFSVQNLMPLEGTEAHLKLTTAAYYLPSGRSLHRTEEATEWGVDPQIEVKLVPKEAIRIALMRRDSEILGPSNPAADGDDEDLDGFADDEPDEPQPDKATEGEQVDGKSKSDGVQAGEGVEKAEEEEPPHPDPNERPEVDPQLETALLVMRIKQVARANPQIALQNGKRSNVVE